MENNNYVNVGNIIEQERLKRQAQIAKGVSSDVYDHIEKAHQDDLSKGVEMTDNLSRFADDVDNLNKAETEFLLSKLQRQIVVDPESSILKSFRSIAIDHLNDIEKAVYVDNSKNRKLGRVGQQYGGKKADSNQSMVNSNGQLNRNNHDAKRFIELDKKYDDKSTRKQMSHEEVSELLSLQKKFHAAQNEWLDKRYSGSKNRIEHGNKNKESNWTPPYNLNLDVVDRLWTERESADYNEALVQNDKKSQNQLLKIAFDRAKKKNINIKAED